MNKNANSRTNNNKQTSPERGYYGARLQTSKRDSVQSAKTRGSNNNIGSNGTSKYRPSSFASDSALPQLQKGYDIPNSKNNKHRRTGSGVGSGRNSGTASLNSYKPKVSPEPTRGIMSKENGRQRVKSPSSNYSSHRHDDVRGMENQYANNVHGQYVDNRNNRNVRFNQNDDIQSRGIPNGDVYSEPKDQHYYNSSNLQYDYMKPFVGTYPDSHVANRSSNPHTNNSRSNQSTEHAQMASYRQTAAYQDLRKGIDMPQDRNMQNDRPRGRDDEMGEFYDRQEMQPPVYRSPKNRQHGSHESRDTHRSNYSSNSNYRTDRSRRGASGERPGDQRSNEMSVHMLTGNRTPHESQSNKGSFSPGKSQFNKRQSDPIITQDNGGNRSEVNHDNNTTRSKVSQVDNVGLKDNKVQYVIRNRSNSDDPRHENKQTNENSAEYQKDDKSDAKIDNGPKINSKGYEFPEVADVDDFDMDDVGIEYEGNDTYICYLKTDAGDVVGPLRLDIDDVQLGLPKFDEEPKEQNQDEGMRNRQTGSHGLNEFSSRSHSMLTLTVDTEQVDPDDENLYLTKRGKLTFVDLAGSEKVKDSNSSAEMLIESNNINRSLLVLGNCISSLGDPKKRQGHIPYRDSKLTKLLADSLGGNGVTLMIACVTPSAYHVHETTNTLRYASRAKRIKSKPVIKMDPREKLILSLKREIKILRNENHYLREQLEFPSKPKGDLQKNNDEKVVKMVKEMQSKANSGDKDLYSMLQEYMIENEALRNENSELHRNKDQLHRDQQSLSKQNEKLVSNIENIQRTMDRSRHNGDPGVQYRSPQGSSKPAYNPPPPQRLPPNQGYVSPNAGRGKPPPSHGQPKRPPHRLSEPLMRPAQRPPEHLQNGYVDEGYMSPRGRPPIQNGGMRQESPMRISDSRRSSQSSTADTIKSINDKLKQELYELDGQINHHHLVNARTRSIYGSQTSMHSVHR